MALAKDNFAEWLGSWNKQMSKIHLHPQSFASIFCNLANNLYLYGNSSKNSYVWTNFC